MAMFTHPSIYQQPQQAQLNQQLNQHLQSQFTGLRSLVESNIARATEPVVLPEGTPITVVNRDGNVDTTLNRAVTLQPADYYRHMNGKVWVPFPADHPTVIGYYVK